MSKYPTPRRFKPKYPEKYVGDVNNIISRSSWELKFMKWADNNPAIVRWISEEIVVPYLSPVDGKMHRYFTDFAILVDKGPAGTKKYMIEIKPEVQTLPPKRGKRTTNKYVNSLATYAVNQSKWAAAEEFCKRQGMQFMILTEKHLY